MPISQTCRFTRKSVIPCRNPKNNFLLTVKKPQASDPNSCTLYSLLFVFESRSRKFYHRPAAPVNQPKVRSVTPIIVKRKP